MGRELEEALRQQVAQPANSCLSESGVSFIDQVIRPLYDVISAEAANNDNGRAPHSAWRNYDDFNEYFWSLSCFELGWPWRKGSIFFLKSSPRSKNALKSGGGKRCGITSLLNTGHFFISITVFIVCGYSSL